jgi:excinuclease ABC subunit C
LPNSPGIYLFKDPEGQIIYIGKAKSIRTRVKSYFQKTTDWKVESLIAEHQTIDFIGTKNETEALLLEAQLISEHKPKFNVLLTSGQPFLYILFTKDDEIPVIKLVRNQREKGFYFGPFLQKSQARGAFRYLIQTFQLFMCNKKIDNGCLDYHIGLCMGSCLKNFSTEDYLFRLELARKALKSNHEEFLKDLKTKINYYNSEMAFEKSRQLTHYRDNLDTIFTTIKTRYTPGKYEDAIITVTAPKTYIAPMSADIAEQMQKFLKLDKPIVTIDCFDISHFQSSSLVGSCIRFVNGIPDKNNFRRFKIRSLIEQNDYAALQEIVSRRYRFEHDFPDLILIDGGKGQLHAVEKVIPLEMPCISLAKREETIFSKNLPWGIKLDVQTEVGRLLIALRDYAHHFAISYHRLKRSKSLEDAHVKTRTTYSRKPRTY